jgi:hypothetical protein
MTELPTPEAAPPTPPPEPPRSDNALAIIGWITAVLIPLPVGMVIGAVLASRDDKRGRWILGVSVGVTLIWIVMVVVLLNAADHQATNRYYYE